MITIDPNPSFRLSEFDTLAASEPLYALEPATGTGPTLASFDPGEVQLVPLQVGREDVARQIASWQESGAVLLGAPALAALLREPTQIPAHWRSLRDGDPSASVRFLGSRFRHRQTGAIHVLELSLADGRWQVQLVPESDAPAAVRVALLGTVAESAWASGD